MITRAEILMGRHTEYPLTAELEENFGKLLKAVNVVRERFMQPMIVSSGYRPGHYNKDANGAKGSLHKTLQAVDFKDENRKLAYFLENNEHILEEAGLYMEQPAFTPTWVHLQTRAPRSGNRIFIP